jgi:rhodanese-related sulfurtransferase
MNTKVTRRKFVHLGGVAVVGAGLASCGATPTATPVPTKPPAAAAATPNTFSQMVAAAMAVVPGIAPAEARQRMERDRNTLAIDVRDAADITASGIIPGASAISYGSLTYQADSEVPPEWRSPQLADRSRPIITNCQAGPLGALAAKLLHDMGFANVSYLAGGIQAWKDAGFPTQAFPR